MPLTVAIPTLGRPTLARTLFSFLDQLADGDEVIIVADPKGDSEYARFVYELGTKRNGVNWQFLIQPGDGWGQPQRNRALVSATDGNHVWCLADDDVATPVALTAIRELVGSAGPRSWGIFRAGRGSDGPWVWQDMVVRVGNLDADCIVAPADIESRWGDGYEGDHLFAQQLRVELGEPAWHSSVIAVTMPSADYLTGHYQALAEAVTREPGFA